MIYEKLAISLCYELQNGKLANIRPKSQEHHSPLYDTMHETNQEGAANTSPDSPLVNPSSSPFNQQ